MFCWSPLTIVDDEPGRTLLGFFTWTNLPCRKLKLEWPFLGLGIILGDVADSVGVSSMEDGATVGCGGAALDTGGA